MTYRVYNFDRIRVGKTCRYSFKNATMLRRGHAAHGLSFSWLDRILRSPFLLLAEGLARTVPLARWPHGAFARPMRLRRSAQLTKRPWRSPAGRDSAIRPSASIFCDFAWNSCIQSSRVENFREFQKVENHVISMKFRLFKMMCIHLTKKEAFPPYLS